MAPAGTSTPTATSGTASISGRVRFAGAVPSPLPVKMSPECTALNPTGVLRSPVAVRDGFLADAVVYVKTGLSGPYAPVTTPVDLDQKACMYAPALVALQVGQPLLVRNSDPLLHNVHGRPNDNDDFNYAQPQQGMESTTTFLKAEALIPVGCDVHPWMRTYASVHPHPFFAVTKEDGTFLISGLPPGTYEIEAVHPRLSPVGSKVTVRDGEAASSDLTFKR